ncbi:MAG: hypothetical protein CMI32_01210 [Opitutales bacterium]|nr:hypothetical protein [Opitutales bacterium]|tara:strand:+ start:163 stop:579 length:417 start_codon:yes stop_codon:yes gene_type:complete
MSDKDFIDVVNSIREQDSRYGKGAYYFVRQALDHALKHVKQEQSENNHHITGKELLEGIREFALDQYGPMTKTLLDAWNIKRCRDFGDIVFHLVDAGVLGKTDNDSPEDFSEGYNFTDAFVSPFLPPSKQNGQNHSNN